MSPCGTLDAMSGLLEGMVVAAAPTLTLSSLLTIPIHFQACSLSSNVRRLSESQDPVSSPDSLPISQDTAPGLSDLSNQVFVPINCFLWVTTFP